MKLADMNSPPGARAAGTGGLSVAAGRVVCSAVEVPDSALPQMASALIASVALGAAIGADESASLESAARSTLLDAGSPLSVVPSTCAGRVSVNIRISELRLISAELSG